MMLDISSRREILQEIERNDYIERIRSFRTEDMKVFPSRKTMVLDKKIISCRKALSHGIAGNTWANRNDDRSQTVPRKITEHVTRVVGLWRWINPLWVSFLNHAGGEYAQLHLDFLRIKHRIWLQEDVSNGKREKISRTGNLVKEQIMWSSFYDLGQPAFERDQKWHKLSRFSWNRFWSPTSLILTYMALLINFQVLLYFPLELESSAFAASWIINMAPQRPRRNTFGLSSIWPCVLNNL